MKTNGMLEVTEEDFYRIFSICKRMLMINGNFFGDNQVWLTKFAKRVKKCLEEGAKNED